MGEEARSAEERKKGQITTEGQGGSQGTKGKTDPIS